MAIPMEKQDIEKVSIRWNELTNAEKDAIRNHRAWEISSGRSEPKVPIGKEFRTIRIVKAEETQLGGIIGYSFYRYYPKGPVLHTVVE